MRAVLEDVQLGRHLGAAQRQIEADAVLGDDPGVGVGMKEEGRRRLRRDAQIVRQVLEELRVGLVAEEVALPSPPCAIAGSNEMTG